MLLGWLVVLTAVLFFPYATDSPTRGDDLTRSTVRLALLYYAAAVVLMLSLRPDEWSASSGRSWLARRCWTLAWATYLVSIPGKAKNRRNAVFSAVCSLPSFRR
jgi:hypothetical protein